MAGNALAAFTQSGRNDRSNLGNLGYMMISNSCRSKSSVDPQMKPQN